MEYLKIVLILVAVCTNIFLGFLTLSKNSKNIVNQLLAGFAGIFALWSLSLFFYDYPVIFHSLFWIRATYLIVIFGIIGCIYYLGFVFPDGKNKPPLIGQILYLIFASLLGYSILFTDSFVKAVIETSHGKQTILGSMYIPFTIYDSVFGFWGMGLLIKKYLHAKGRAKAQLKYLFSGLALFIITVLILDSAIPLLTGDSSYFSISTVGSLFFVGFTVYAIIKYRFLDIRIALQEVLAFTLTTFILSVICFSGALGFWIINKTAVKYEVIAVVVIVSGLLTLFFNKIVIFSRLMVSKLTGLPFYDFEKTILNMSLSLNASLDIGQLIKNLCNLFINFLGVDDMAFVLRDENNQEADSSRKSHYSIIRKIGFNQELNFLDDGILITYIERNPQMLILEEIGIRIERSNDETEKYYLRELYTHMEYSRVCLILPLAVHNQVLGIIALGSKKSGDPFTIQDIDLITTTMSQFSNALENAISFSKIKQFNLTLTEEIEKATLNLKKANVKLQNLDKLKDDFVSVASHELRTPMTAIRSYAWMALHRSDIPLSQKMERYLYRTLISTERLINLVNDMLNVSRIEAGKIEITPKSFDIGLLVKEMVEEVTAKAAEKRLQIQVLEHSVPLVFADSDKVRQVLLNLIGNSIKFTYPGGIITVDFFSDGQMVEISIKDNGAGISRDDLSRLFHKFARLDNSYVSLSTSGGTGLGLYISKSLVELMKGKIWARSEGVDKGSTFTFSLPIAAEDTLKEAERYHIAPGEGKQLEPAAI